jgi:hypothetical protein
MAGLHGCQTSELLEELMMLVDGDRGEEQYLVHLMICG